MTYHLLDSGNGRKLEKIGNILVDRQAPAACWRPRLDPSEWSQVDGRHHRLSTGGGRWEWIINEPGSWTVEHGGLNLRIKPTPFGHLGLFAEQAEQWSWLRGVVEGFINKNGRPPRLLNLFAYTGGSTLAAASSGADVTHVDSAKGVVAWARENASANDLQDAPIRWVTEDCRSYLSREAKRKSQYDGIILDPPSFGRGPKGEVWKIEDHLDGLMAQCSRLLREPAILLLSCHSSGYSPTVLENILADHFNPDGIHAHSGEMLLSEEASSRSLPSGTVARWSPSDL